MVTRRKMNNIFFPFYKPPYYCYGQQKKHMQNVCLSSATNSSKDSRPSSSSPSKPSSKSSSMPSLMASLRESSKQSSKPAPPQAIIEIYGLKLFYDDLLILLLIYFLYQEKINDTILYVALFALLLP